MALAARPAVVRTALEKPLSPGDASSPCGDGTQEGGESCTVDAWASGARRCGDDLCIPPENSTVCPSDCPNDVYEWCSSRRDDGDETDCQRSYGDSIAGCPGDCSLHGEAALRPILDAMIATVACRGLYDDIVGRGGFFRGGDAVGCLAECARESGLTARGGSVTTNGAWVACVDAAPQDNTETYQHCSNTIQDVDEMSVDCDGDRCLACHCKDGLQNSGEAGVDCGGPGCKPCGCEGYFKQQADPGTRSGYRAIRSRCFDNCANGERDAGEAGVDCGGSSPCGPCPP